MAKLRAVIGVKRCTEKRVLQSYSRMFRKWIEGGKLCNQNEALSLVAGKPKKGPSILFAKMIKVNLSIRHRRLKE